MEWLSSERNYNHVRHPLPVESFPFSTYTFRFALDEYEPLTYIGGRALKEITPLIKITWNLYFKNLLRYFGKKEVIMPIWWNKLDPKFEQVKGWIFTENKKTESKR